MMSFCQLRQEALTFGEFSTGKRWDAWKVDYLKSLLTKNIHLDSVSKLRCQITLLFPMKVLTKILILNTKFRPLIDVNYKAVFAGILKLTAV